MVATRSRLPVQPSGPCGGDRRVDADARQGLHRLGQGGRGHATAISGISPARLEALLESIMLERQMPGDLDSEAIEAVLIALQADELTKVKPSDRVGRDPRRSP